MHEYVLKVIINGYNFIHIFLHETKFNCTLFFLKQYNFDLILITSKIKLHTNNSNYHFSSILLIIRIILQIINFIIIDYNERNSPELELEKNIRKIVYRV